MISLKNLNNYASILHALSAIAVMTTFYIKGQDANFDIDFYRLKISNLTSDNRQASFSVEKAINNTTKNLEIIIISIFLITSFFHIFYSTNGFGTNAYEGDINNSFNRWRWLEYGITSTLMIFILVIISGTKDFGTAFSLCFINIMLMATGFYIEQMPNRNNKIVGLVIGFLAVVFSFTIIFYNFFNRLDEVKKIPDPVELPSWLNFVLVPMLFWWLSFGVVATMNVVAMNKPNYDFKKYEKYYIYLSFLAKAFMGYYIAYGFSRDAPDR